MKFTTIFFFYSALLGGFVGAIAALFLLFVEWCIDFVWHVVPERLEWSFYPLAVGVIGGVMIGLLQKYMGNYPKTIHETLHEFQQKKAVAYKQRLWPNFLMGVIVLACGASLGPEGALASIVGGLIAWVGDRLKLTLQQKEQLIQLEIGAMLSAIFHAPLIGVSEGIEQLETTYPKWQKIMLYGLSTACGIATFSGVNKLFQKESIFAITTPDVIWSWQVWLFIIPALIVGYMTGLFFLWSERLLDLYIEKIRSKLLRGILGGICIGLFGMYSSYFLFSGEHALAHFSVEAVTMSIGTVLFIGIGKILLTNICFACGWRGGKIFPAIFASVAIGFALANLFSYTPGLIIAIVVTSCCTVILGQPIVTIALLLLLFPLQFAPFLIVAALIVQRFRKNKIQSENTTTA